MGDNNNDDWSVPGAAWGDEHASGEWASHEATDHWGGLGRETRRAPRTVVLLGAGIAAVVVLFVVFSLLRDRLPSLLPGGIGTEQVTREAACLNASQVLAELSVGLLGSEMTLQLVREHASSLARQRSGDPRVDDAIIEVASASQNGADALERLAANGGSGLIGDDLVELARLDPAIGDITQSAKALEEACNTDEALIGSAGV